MPKEKEKLEDLCEWCGEATGQKLILFRKTNNGLVEELANTFRCTKCAQKLADKICDGDA